MSIENLIWVLTGAVTLIAFLGGAIWKILRDESKDHAKKIDEKADIDRLHESETRWLYELNAVKEGNEKLITKLEARHDRDLDQMATRLSEQIRNTEQNILSQLRLMLGVINDGK